MSTLTAVILPVQGIAFLIWTIVFFKAIFGIRRIAAAETGSINPGPFSFIAAARVWMRDPATRLTRIIWLTAFAVIVVCMIVSATRGSDSLLPPL